MPYLSRGFYILTDGNMSYSLLCLNSGNRLDYSFLMVIFWPQISFFSCMQSSELSQRIEGTLLRCPDFFLGGVVQLPPHLYSAPQILNDFISLISDLCFLNLTRMQAPFGLFTLCAVTWKTF